MCESRATVLGSLIGDEEHFMKEINNSLTNSFCLVPRRLASVTLRIRKDEGEPRISIPLKTWKNNVQWKLEGRYSEGDSGSWGPGRREGGDGWGVAVIVVDMRQGRSNREDRLSISGREGQATRYKSRSRGSHAGTTTQTCCPKQIIRFSRARLSRGICMFACLPVETELTE